MQIAFLDLRIVAVPDCRVVVALSGHHDGCHDCGDVEGWPVGHELVKQGLGCEVLVSAFSHFLLNWDSSGIVKRVGVVSIIVCLDQEPIGFIELVMSMNSFGISFDNASFIWSNA